MTRIILIFDWNNSNFLLFKFQRSIYRFLVFNQERNNTVITWNGPVLIFTKQRENSLWSWSQITLIQQTSLAWLSNTCVALVSDHAVVVVVIAATASAAVEYLCSSVPDVYKVPYSTALFRGVVVADIPRFLQNRSIQSKWVVQLTNQSAERWAQISATFKELCLLVFFPRLICTVLV